VLLVDATLSIAFRNGGQLSLVVSFETVFLFVMSGAGLTPSNFNAEASDSKLSGRNVPMIGAFSLQSVASAIMSRSRFLLESHNNLGT
jgi:hypothetical protein